MDTVFINGEEYVRIEPTKFVKRSLLAVTEPVRATEPVKAAEPVKAEPVKAEPVKAVKVAEPVKAEPVKAAEPVTVKVAEPVKAVEQPQKESTICFAVLENKHVTVSRDVEIFLPKEVYDFVSVNLGESFIAKNGFKLVCGRWSNEWSPDRSLFMDAKEFRGKRANMTKLFPSSSAKATAEHISTLKTALTELSVAFKERNKTQVVDLSHMESL